MSTTTVQTPQDQVISYFDLDADVLKANLDVAARRALDAANVCAEMSLAVAFRLARQAFPDAVALVVDIDHDSEESRLRQVEGPDGQTLWVAPAPMLEDHPSLPLDIASTLFDSYDWAGHLLTEVDVPDEYLGEFCRYRAEIADVPAACRIERGGRMVVEHVPVWQPADLRIDAAGNTKPGLVCVHELENGNGQCGGNVFSLDETIGKHGCVVQATPEQVDARQPVDDKLAHLSTEELANMARRVFNVLEYGEPNGDGGPGYEWDSDTCSHIADIFTANGARVSDIA